MAISHVAEVGTTSQTGNNCMILQDPYSLAQEDLDGRMDKMNAVTLRLGFEARVNYGYYDNNLYLNLL